MMRIRLFTASCLLGLIFSLFAGKAGGGAAFAASPSGYEVGESYRVAYPRVSLREMPSSKSALKDVLLCGDVVVLTGVERGVVPDNREWARVRYSRGEGYILASLLARNPSEYEGTCLMAFLDDVPYIQVRVRYSRVALRALPHPQAGMIRSLLCGQQIAVYARTLNRDWFMFKDEIAGGVGFLRRDFVVLPGERLDCAPDYDPSMHRDFVATRPLTTYLKPNFDAFPVRRISAGETVRIYAVINDGWGLTQHDNGVIAYAPLSGLDESTGQ